MKTTIYLIRHSIRLDKNYIIQYFTNQDRTIQSEKSVLSVEGERRAEILSHEAELQNLDLIYTSNCVRTLQTAKYLIEQQDLKVTIDDRFDERRVGTPNDALVPDWWIRQYLDENYKTEGGESQKEVRDRFSQAFFEILNQHPGKRIAIFSHGYAITFFIMKWCQFEFIQETENLKFTFNGKEIFNQKINAPEVFKLEFNDNNQLTTIENIVFEDLPYQYGFGK